MKKLLLFLLLLPTMLLAQVTPPGYPYADPLPTTGTIPVKVTVTQAIAPSAYNDNRPAVWDDFVGGGYQTKGTTTERDGILSNRRKEGMLVYVAADDHIYRLDSNLTSWIDLGAANSGAFGQVDTTIYDVNGTLTGARLLTGAGYPLTFNGLSNFIVTNASGVVAMTAANVNLGGTTATTVGYGTATPVIFPASPSSTIVSTDQLMMRDTSGNLKLSPAYTAAQIAAIGTNNVNIFNNNGTLTGNRSVSGGGLSLSITNVGAYSLLANTISGSATTAIYEQAGSIASYSAGSTVGIYANSGSVTINGPSTPWLFQTTPVTAASTNFIVFRGSDGSLRWDPLITKDNITAANTLYTGNGLISGDRFVTGGGNDLIFNDIGSYAVTATTLIHQGTGDGEYAVNGTLELGGGTALKLQTPGTLAFTPTTFAGQYLRSTTIDGDVEYSSPFYVAYGTQAGSVYEVINADLVPDYNSSSAHPDGTVVYLKVDAASVGADLLQLGPSTPARFITHHDGTTLLAGEMGVYGAYYVLVYSSTTAKWILQGMSATPAAGSAATATVTVDTVADLVAFDHTAAKQAVTRGYWSVGDGGGGSYYWLNSVTATNRGSKIASAVSGSWTLIPQVAGVSVKSFGAKGDVGIAWLRNTGTPITPTDDKVAIQEAVNWCGENGIPMLVPNGRYHIGSTITNRSATGVVIKGVTQNQSLAAQNGVVNTPQSMFVRSGNYTLFQFAGALTTAEMSAGYYTQSWQKYVQVSDMLFEDTYTAPTTTAPMIVMKRSVLSRWNRVSFIGVNSTVLDLWTADDGIFTDCRWMSCGYYDKPAILLHRNETDGSEHIYSTINTLTFTDCVFEYNYNASIYTSRSGIGDNGNINFNGTQFKQHRPINPVPVVDMYRTDGLSFHDTLVTFGTDNIPSAKTLSSIVHLESCRADGKLNVAQITHSSNCVITNAVRIVDPRGGRLEIDVSSGLTGVLAGDVLVRVDSTIYSYYNFSLSGRSFISSALADTGAYAGKPFSNHPTDEFAKNAEHGRKLSAGAAFNGASYYTAVMTSRTIDTNDFTIVTDVEVPNLASDYGVWLLGDSAGTPPIATASSLSLYWDDGLLKLRYVNGSSVATVLSSSEQILQKIYAKRTLPITVIRRNGLFELWFDNARLQLTGTQTLTTDAISSTVKLHVGIGYNGASLYSKQRIASAAIYNYAMTQAELYNYRNFGINEIDKWVVATAHPLAATFDTTTESFAIEDGGSLTANGAGQMTFTLPASGASKAARTSNINGVKNKRHRISVNAWNTSGTPIALTAGLRSNSSTDTTTNSSFAFTPTGSSAWYSGIVGPEVQNNIAFRLGVTGGNSSVYLIDGIVVEQLGCIGAWEFNESGVAANDLVGKADMLSPGTNPTVSSIAAAPRMTTTLRTAIPNVSAGTVVYDTTLGGNYLYNGTAWVRLSEVESPAAMPDADFTYTPGTGSNYYIELTAITANRVITLSSIGAYEGCKFTLVRSFFTPNPYYIQIVGNGTKQYVGQTIEFIYQNGSWRQGSATASRDIPILAVMGDTSDTVYTYNGSDTFYYNTVLTADRTLTLSTSGVYSGSKFTVVRSAAATGAFNLTISGKVLAAGTWADFIYDTSLGAWLNVRSGSL